MFPRFPPCCSRCQQVSLCFEGWVLFSRVDGARFVYPLVCWWTLRLLPPFGHGEYAAVNTDERLALWLPALTPSVSIAQSGIPGTPSLILLGKSHRTVFRRSCSMLSSHPQGTRDPISPRFRQHLSFSVSLFSHLNACGWHVTTVLYFLKSVGSLICVGESYGLTDTTDLL